MDISTYLCCCGCTVTVNVVGAAYNYKVMFVNKK